VPLWIRLIASPSKGATDSTMSFFDLFSLKAMVLVTASPSSLELFILSMAGPDRTGWMQLA
jgi:hypothetical protein